METLFLAQLLGLFSIIFAVAIILRRKMVMHVMHDFFNDRKLAFVVGIGETLAGLLLVLSHNSWDSMVAVALSLLGWAVLLEGVFYLFATQKFIRKLTHMFDSVSGYYFFAVLYLLLGVYLAYIGFGLNL